MARVGAQASFATSQTLGLGFGIDFGFIMTLNTVRFKQVITSNVWCIVAWSDGQNTQLQCWRFRVRSCAFFDYIIEDKVFENSKFHILTVAICTQYTTLPDDQRVSQPSGGRTNRHCLKCLGLKDLVDKSVYTSATLHIEKIAIN